MKSFFTAASTVVAIAFADQSFTTPELVSQSEYGTGSADQMFVVPQLVAMSEYGIDAAGTGPDIYGLTTIEYNEMLAGFNKLHACVIGTLIPLKS